jgi:fluoride exporter
MIWVAVALGGAVGAACRYVVDFAVAGRTRGAFPWGTWTVNMLGSLVLGLLVGAMVGAGESALWHVAATSGFCGAFTTFSTFAYETVQLIERRAWWEAAWNLASQAVGIAVAGAGVWLGTVLG